MITRMTWPELCRSDKFRGLWVAIDNCRYDQDTRQPIEGDVVDSDPELSELCARMRETGQSACTIVFCDGHVYVEPGQSFPTSAQSARATS
jgi:prepilin-type processing-associated H-X9-DG protein